MQNLFIIGNGFDLQHGMPTKMSDFKAYIESVYCKDDTSIVPLSTEMLPDGAIVASNESLARLIYNLVEYAACLCGDSEWSNFENYLACIEWEQYFSEVALTVDECIEMDDNPFLGTSLNEEYAGELVEGLGSVPKLFGEWVEDAENSSNPEPIQDYSSLFSEKDSAFVTFNYTCTLEFTYAIPEDKICHLHGICHYGDIIVGHGRNEYQGNDPESEFLGIFDACRQAFERLKKNGNQVLEEHYNFLKKATQNCKNVFICGHGLGPSDDYFYRFLQTELADDVNIIVFDYKGDSADKIKKLRDDFDFKNVVAMPLPGSRST